MDQLHRDVQQERLRLEGLKQELTQQIEGLDKVRNGDYVKTGELETWTEVCIGENLYKRMRNAEILIKDGVVTAILEG